MSERLPPGLHIVATPIGNLADLSPRAADTLRPSCRSYTFSLDRLAQSEIEIE